jgi:V8-like Glu-specific endopeptidase
MRSLRIILALYIIILAAVCVTVLVATEAWVQTQPRPEKRAAAPQIVLVTDSDGGTCTGSVVGKDKILTAGHCMNAGKTYAVTFVGGYSTPAFLLQRGEAKQKYDADWALLAAQTGKIAPITMKSLPKAYPKDRSLTVFSFPDASPTQVVYPAFLHHLTPQRLGLITVVHPGDSGSPVLYVDDSEKEGVSMAGIIVAGSDKLPVAIAIPVSQFKGQIEAIK